jgi:predicted nucleotidyltransferase
MTHPNLQQLIAAARLLKPLLDEVVFVGGCTTVLFISDSGIGGLRATFDVDVITEITSYWDYIRFSARLRGLNFDEDTSDGAPLCRWKNGDSTLDVMPMDESVLGFSNRWYKDATDRAQVIELEAGLQVRVVSAPYFCATKIEAFKGRGKNDYLSSRDLEDLITVLDGRPELLDELRSAPDDVRSYIVEAANQMLDTTEFIDALPGYLLPDAASQSRITIILAKLKKISSWQ